MFRKRLLAYILDIIILSIILSFVGMIFPTSDSLSNLSNQLLSLSNDFAQNDMSFITFINRYAVINFSIAKLTYLPNLVSVAVSICYFIIYPLYNGGASIGKKMMKLKIVNIDGTEVGVNKLILRYMFIDSIGVSIVSLCLVFILGEAYYTFFVLFLDFLQFIVVILSIFMILYRRGFRSLPDFIAGTKVIEVK